MKGRGPMTIDLPAHMIAMHTTLARLHIGPAGTNIVLHANRLILGFSKFDGATVRDLDAPFAVLALILTSLPFAFGRVVWQGWNRSLDGAGRGGASRVGSGSM